MLASRLRHVVEADRVVRSDAGYAAGRGLARPRCPRRLRGRGRPAAGRPVCDSGSTGRSHRRGCRYCGARCWPTSRAAPWAGAERTVADRLLVPDPPRPRLRPRWPAAAWATAAALAEQVLAGDPYDEAGLRVLMEAMARAGRTASALAVYASARQRLAEDLGIGPSAATEALHTAVLLGEAGSDRAGAVRSDPEAVALAGQADALAALGTLFGVGRASGGRVGAGRRRRPASASPGSSRPGRPGWPATGRGWSASHATSWAGRCRSGPCSTRSATCAARPAVATTTTRKACSAPTLRC